MSHWRFFIAPLSFLLLLSCKKNQEELFKLEVADMEDMVVDLGGLRHNEFSVLYFLGPECPLCQNYSVNIKALQEKFEGSGVNFYAIFPGTEYNAREISQFLIRFQLEMKSYLDPKFNLTEFLGASATPEVFVINRNGRILYSGAIDNWAIDLGQKRANITEFYLEDALSQAISGKKIQIVRTEPVGCFIQ